MNNASPSIRHSAFRPPRGYRGAVGGALLAAAVLAILAMPAWLSSSSAPTSSEYPDARMVYTVAELRRAIDHNPGAWMGQSVRVRGTALLVRTRIDPFTWHTQFLLVDSTRVHDARLPLALGTPTLLLMLLRQMPLIGRYVPRTQTPQLGTEATYRVELHALPGGPSNGDYEAILLDAAA